MDRNRLIGNRNQLPWHLPADLAHFKKITLNKPILMGRKTYESIGRPLPGRQNIVLTHNRSLNIEGVTVVNSLEEAIESLKDASELMVIGGSTLYELALPQAQRMYLTYVDGEFEGDAWFPEFDENEWNISELVTQEPDEKNSYGCRFITYERK